MSEYVYEILDYILLPKVINKSSVTIIQNKRNEHFFNLLYLNIPLKYNTLIC